MLQAGIHAFTGASWCDISRFVWLNFIIGTLQRIANFGEFWSRLYMITKLLNNRLIMIVALKE